MPEMKVTPWEVIGDIDYGRLVKEFGLSEISPELKIRLRKFLGDNLFIRRGVFAFHRDLDFILNEYEKGNKFYLYTGRGPSGNTHMGHLIPWIFTKQLQDAFGTKLLFQLTDDEKFLFRQDLTLDDVEKYSMENLLDIIAVGFDPKLTEVFTDTGYAKTLYKEAVKVAKHITFSTTKAVFGFDNDSNVGRIFFTSMQAVPAMLESARKGKNVPCLIPHAVDQDAHFRIARDVLPKMGYYKPASIQCKFIPGLGKGGKMSASEPATTIFTTDDAKTIEKKVKSSFTGGRETTEEQKKKGGQPDICPIFSYYQFLFEPDDKKLAERKTACKGGKLMCGECKAQLVPRAQKFFADHQKKREQARKVIDKFLKAD